LLDHRTTKITKAHKNHGGHTAHEEVFVIVVAGVVDELTTGASGR
jgi:hypothetical protein